MERLTKRLQDGKAVMDCDSCGLKTSRKCTLYECRNQLMKRLAAYEDTGLEPEAVETVKLALCAKQMVDLETLNNTPISRLVELAEADKAGRVVVMPCKFGDKLYRVFGEEIQEFTVSNIKYMGLQHRWSVDTTPFILYAENLIGTELFLAREEAEKAMKGETEK